jgi:hypothetical protein
MLKRRLHPAQDFIENAPTSPAAPIPRSGFVHGRNAALGPAYVSCTRNALQ